MKLETPILFHNEEEVKEAIALNYIPDNIANQYLCIYYSDNGTLRIRYLNSVNEENVKLFNQALDWENIKIRDNLTGIWYLQRESIGKWVKVATKKRTFVAKFRTWKLIGDNCYLYMFDDMKKYKVDKVRLLTDAEIINIIEELLLQAKGDK